jgi:hypothetical protein
MIMPRKTTIAVLLGLLLSLAVTAVYAQDGPGPWPTPTNVPVDVYGTVRGFVYLDVNGDGKCVNTGVAGETPVEGIPIEFVSSDEKTVITNTSAANGAYELAGAGQSYWRVTAKPDAAWVVTSENPLYAPVYPDNLAATDVNFCVQKAGTAVFALASPVNATVSGDYILPEAGAAQNSALLWPFLLGIGLILFGAGWRWYELNRR